MSNTVWGSAGSLFYNGNANGSSSTAGGTWYMTSNNSMSSEYFQQAAAQQQASFYQMQLEYESHQQRMQVRVEVINATRLQDAAEFSGV